ncbi:MAG: HTH-type transcriptional regulator UlaR [Anaerolineae bacterium]|nr:HTH-type transcriptional regulator UlaR [Anaerolineae bacterium]
MHFKQRLEQIVKLVEQNGFVSVADLSQSLNVHAVTIRRDLKQLDQQKRLRRTHGGAFALQTISAEAEPAQPVTDRTGFLAERIDVLITTSTDPYLDRSLLSQATQGNIPIVAESVWMNGAKTLVAIDSYQAAFALGQWAGNYTLAHFAGRACILDLTFELSNTRARGQGFLDGVRSVLPAAKLALSINAQSRGQAAYQITADAFVAHPDINIIFAANDTMAAGALEACRERGVSPDDLIVMTFGLTGDTLKNALVDDSYCKAGVAMFPEIVGRVCIEAAIAAFNGNALPLHLVTPYAVLTAQTLNQFFERADNGWQIKWETALNQLTIPVLIDKYAPRTTGKLPKRVGFVVPFMEHEWYQNLIVCLCKYAGTRGIEVEVIDADQILRDDIKARQQQIARTAAETVKPGDVLFIDNGQVTGYLAEELARKKNLANTIITNSMDVFDALRDIPGNTLILTGGIFRQSSKTLIGPTSEAALRELRADKLFLAVTGITLDFGLSHINIAEVAIKQAMIRAAHEVILLADHTVFGCESVMQIGPVTQVHKVITDNALPAELRLELGKLGIETVIAE